MLPLRSFSLGFLRPLRYLFHSNAAPNDIQLRTQRGEFHTIILHDLFHRITSVDEESKVYPPENPIERKSAPRSMPGERGDFIFVD